ncbi:MAG: hypothetical protein ACE5HL_07995 [Terriglobia bacterium]
MMSRGGVLKGKYHHLRFIIPFRGDFSQYDKVEIVRLGSDLGPDTVPPEKMEKYTEWLQQLFVNTGLFDEVGIVEEAELGPTPPAPATTLPPEHAASPAASEEQELALLPRSTPLLLARLDPKAGISGLLSDPTGLPLQAVTMLPAELPASPAAAGEESPGSQPNSLPQSASADPEEDFTGIPPQDALVVIQPPPPPAERRTLVVISTVMDYLKGNRGLRMLGVGIGGSRFTVRFSIYDKQTGKEVARGNVTGAVEDSSFGLPGGSGSDQSLKVTAGDLVQHVESRVRNADR